MARSGSPRYLKSSMSKFDDFAKLHVAGNPLVLFNAWDPGSAIAVAKSGARAIATGSASVSMANGFGDGQEVPIDLALANATRIVSVVDVPVTVDFEGGYASDPAGLTANARRLAETGARRPARRNGSPLRHCRTGRAPQSPARRRRDRLLHQPADRYLPEGQT